MFRVIVFAVGVIMLGSCHKEAIPVVKECIPVSFVRGICGQAVLKIENPSYYHLGENADGDEHVFLAKLECFTDLSSLEDKSLFVERDPANFNEDCATCLAMIAYSGSKHYNVRLHKACNPVRE